ncbi:MAG TPA: hypothetical protein VL652_34850 [Kutzneria sp.]|nr:hypothetical protein [Kutzneria sp.]
MTTERVFLVIGADRKIRAARRPQLRIDEVAIGINLNFPDGWGRVVGDLTVNVPDFAPDVDLAVTPDA